jgi:hypothetical protein
MPSAPLPEREESMHAFGLLYESAERQTQLLRLVVQLTEKKGQFESTEPQTAIFCKAHIAMLILSFHPEYLSESLLIQMFLILMLSVIEVVVNSLISFDCYEEEILLLERHTIDN